MTLPINHEDVLNYFRYDEDDGGIPTNNFWLAFNLWVAVIDMVYAVEFL
jgi:hypothetical protein